MKWQNAAMVSAKSWENIFRARRLGHRLHGLTGKGRLELQPLPVLKRRGILETTLRHELVHVVIDAVGGKQTTVRDLIRTEGEIKLWQRVAQRRYDIGATAR